MDDYKKYLKSLAVYLKGPLEKGYKEAEDYVFSIRGALGLATETNGKHPYLIYHEMRELPICFFCGTPFIVTKLSDVRKPGTLLLESRKRDYIYHPPNPNSLLEGKRFLSGLTKPYPATNNGKKLYRPINKSWVLKHPDVLEQQVFYLIKSE